MHFLFSFMHYFRSYKSNNFLYLDFMAKKKVLKRKLAIEKAEAAQKRWEKRNERRTSAQHASQARWAKKAVQSRDIDKEATKQLDDRPTTSTAATAGPVPTLEMILDPVPPLETAEEATEQLEDVPMATSESVPLLETPLTARSVRPFCLDDGNGQRIIDAICLEADVCGCGEEVRRRLTQAGGRRHPRTKQFTGADIYRLLDHPNPDLLTDPIPPGPLKLILSAAMFDLRVVYRLSRATLFLPEDLDTLEHWTKKFYDHWLELRSLDQARYPVRPTLHLLAAHVVPFARTHQWWGLISEQGMEHMHQMCNNLVGRYSHLGESEKIVEKLVRHVTLLNALHDRGIENEKENRNKYPDF